LTPRFLAKLQEEDLRAADRSRGFEGTEVPKEFDGKKVRPKDPPFKRWGPNGTEEKGIGEPTER
jgi:hypothetical protein